jgi:hydroxyacid-oxoacid transhydrogenase
MIQTETVFNWAAPPIKFGCGALSEIGWDVAHLGAHRILVVTDRGVAATGLADDVAATLRASGLVYDIYDEVAIEPTDESIDKAVEHARGGSWDALVALGGGSVIDTAKAVNLLVTHPGTLMDYVAKPVGGGQTPDRTVLPLVAVPTTAGTGSESTTICVVDLLGMRLKAGISAGRLRPALAIIDPLTTLTLGPEVTAACGVDVLSHAVESYTAKRFDARVAVDDPSQRAAFCGSNPISDLWCEEAIRLVGSHLRAAVANGTDVRARTGMMLASTYAGIGFGNAGTHLPHANAYPVAGQVESYRAKGYPEMPMVPHGQAVASTAIPSFRYTYPACRKRHLRAAELLAGPDIAIEPGPDALPDALDDLFRDIDIPRGIGAFGFTADDIPNLVAGTLKQQRQLSVVPRPVDEASLRAVFEESLHRS